jgi:hypothetical protein
MTSCPAADEYLVTILIFHDRHDVIGRSQGLSWQDKTRYFCVKLTFTSTKVSSGVSKVSADQSD